MFFYRFHLKCDTLIPMRKNNLKNTLIFFNIFCKYRYTTFFSCLCFSRTLVRLYFLIIILNFFVCCLNRHIRAIFTVIALSNLSYKICLLISCVVVGYCHDRPKWRLEIFERLFSVSQGRRV